MKKLLLIPFILFAFVSSGWCFDSVNTLLSTTDNKIEDLYSVFTTDNKAGDLYAMSGAFMGSGQTVAGGGPDCPVGTYDSYWTGDASEGSLYICYNSGASQKQGTNTNGDFGTDYGEGGGDIGWFYNNTEDNLSWAISTADLIDFTSAFTIWVRLKHVEDASVADVVAFESYYDANNYLYVILDNDGTVDCAWKGNGTTDAKNSTNTMSLDTWTTIGYSVIPGESTAAVDHSVKVGANAWEDENDNPVAMGTVPTTIKIGNLETGVRPVEQIHYTNFAVLPGFKTASPW